jgi:nucleoside-diphosphate-sugar epimerase
MSDERAAVLITGADGYLGRRIARRLRDAGMPLLLWVRATSGAELERKRAALDAELSEPRRDGMDTDSAGTGPCGAASAAIRFASGDLAATEPFDGIDPDSVRLIVHTAAVTRFNVDEETARRVNVDGTAKLLRFAAAALPAPSSGSYLKALLPRSPVSGERARFARSRFRSPLREPL